MRKYTKKAVAFLLVCIMALGAILMNIMEVRAHEIYHINGVGVPLVWNHTSNGNVVLDVNDDYLDSALAADYAYALTAWPNGTGKVIVNEVALINSHLDFGTATASVWSDYFGIAALITFGYTRIADTNGTMIQSAYVAQSSTGRIQSAAILLNPNYDNWDTDAEQRFVIAHEIGHAIGFGHSDRSGYSPSPDPSIMVTDPPGTYYTLQPHDVSDFENKY